MDSALFIIKVWKMAGINQAKIIHITRVNAILVCKEKTKAVMMPTKKKKAAITIKVKENVVNKVISTAAVKKPLKNIWASVITRMSKKFITISINLLNRTLANIFLELPRLHKDFKYVLS